MLRVFFFVDFVFWFGFFLLGKGFCCSAVKAVGGEECTRDLFFSLCSCDEAVSKKHERRQQYISLLCSPCLQSAAPGE